MINSDTNPLADSLVYEDMLPLFWSARVDGSPPVNLARVSEHNEHVMRCVNLLGEQIKEKIDEVSETESALMRLDAKVNLLLEMVSNLSRDRIDLPEVNKVRLASGGMEWWCQKNTPAAGDNIWVTLHIDSRIPESLKLAARVISVSADEFGSRVAVRFEEVGEVVQDQLEKMIFRNHRRKVAQSRSA